MEIKSAPPTHYLNSAFIARKRKNSRFSLRAFAKILGISSGRLSEVLSGKRGITDAMAEKISKGLALSPKDAVEFKRSVRRYTLTAANFENCSNEPSLHEYQVLENDKFQIIAEWQHYAILSLIKTKTFRNDCKWIAARLGISSIEASDSLDRLTRCGLICNVAGKITRTKQNLTTTSDVSSSALRHAHEKNLLQSIDALEAVHVELRDITSITFGIDLSDIVAIKERIQKFRREMSRDFESLKAEEVYNLNIQLVPVTKLNQGGKS